MKRKASAAQQLTYKIKEKEYKLIASKTPTGAASLLESLLLLDGKQVEKMQTRSYGVWELNNKKITLYLSVHHNSYEHAVIHPYAIHSAITNWVYRKKRNNILELFLKTKGLKLDGYKLDIVLVSRTKEERKQLFYRCFRITDRINLMRMTPELEFQLPVVFLKKKNKS